MVKLFSKSFKRRRLFEKRRHPKTFITKKAAPRGDAAFFLFPPTGSYQPLIAITYEPTCAVRLT
ncbi:hypothetical protein CXP35_10205 [Komagataeibacter xylinus]|nr:hypothetical protein CXP35_10205 [Komagataeibacter xylinus]